MALESWLTKVKSAVSAGLVSVRSTMTADVAAIAALGRKKATVGILAFEIASLMSKLLHLWRSLSDASIARLRHETIHLQGVRKVVSDDDAFLLGLACAELAESLRIVAESTSALAGRCADPTLRGFGRAFREFADAGHDPHRWVMSWKDMESKAKKMDRYVTSTAALYKELDGLSEAEHGLRRLLQSSQSLPAGKIAAVADLQQKIFWQRQEVKYMKQTSLWSCTFDTVVSLLARSAFTVLARLKNVFCIGQEAVPLPRSLSVSAAVYPSSDTPPAPPPPARFSSDSLSSVCKQSQCVGFFESNSAMLVPPPSTLGAAALAQHYANLIIVIEKMIRSPRAVGPDARDDLYAMLPASMRGLLRARLRGVGGWWRAAADPGLAAEWRAALGRIMEWLGPVARSTVRWQGERSFERRSAAAPRANVLLLQTLAFASREKVEAAVAELLVGLNYVLRFEREMAARALLLQRELITSSDPSDSSKCLE